MLKRALLSAVLFTPLWSAAAPVVFDDGTYKALLESSDCQPPVTVRVEAQSADDFGYLNPRFQESIRQISTLAWLRCSAAKELQIRAIMPPATEPVMEFPVRVAEQWQIRPPQQPSTPSPELSPSPTPSSSPSPPPEAKEWATSQQPVSDNRLAEAVGKPESLIEPLTEAQKLALMELLAAQAGSLEAWEALAAQAQKGSRTAKLALANLLLRTKDQAPMNEPGFLEEVVQIPESVAEQGSLAAARHLLEELSQDSAGSGLGMLPTVDAGQSHDVLQVAFAQWQPQPPADPPPQSPSAEASRAAAMPPPEQSAANNGAGAKAPSPPAGGIPAFPPGAPPQSPEDPNNPSSSNSTTVID